MTYPEHDFSGSRQDWERRTALSADTFTSILVVGRSRCRAEFKSLNAALAHRFDSHPQRTPLVYAVSPLRAEGTTRRSVHLDVDLVEYLILNGRT